jgi:hypothetical protein
MKEKMRRRVLELSLFAAASAVNLSAQNTVYSYSLPNSMGTAQWALIGTLTAPQNGHTATITAFIPNGYGATISADSVYVITFQTSNGALVNSSGFAASGSWYAIGFNNAIPAGNIKWVANATGVSATSYGLYILLPTWTGSSQYNVSVDQASSWTNSATLGKTNPGSASSTVLVPTTGFNLPYGNVGIGTTTPGAMLEIDGNVKLTANSGASITFADGTVQSTAYTGVTCGGDYAESVDVMGGRTKYEPGDLLVIDPDDPGRFLKSAEPYSTLVAGILFDQARDGWTA